MSNVSKAFGGLRKQIWLNKDLSIKTKYAVYHAIVFSILLYVIETWTVYKADAQRLHVYMIRHLPKLLNVKWRHHIPNKLILEKCKLPGMYDIIAQSKQRWVDHLDKLENSRLLKLREGSRKTGTPKLRYKNIIKINQEVANIPLGSC